MKKFVIISIHDVSPIYIKELRIIFKKLKGIKKEILVVPNWGDRYNIFENKELVRMVKEEMKNGALIGLHGYSHKGKIFPFERLFFDKQEIGQNEFLDITKKELIEKIKNGRADLYNTFKSYPKKFVAPRWILNKKYFNILKRFGFKYTESIWNIFLLNKNKKVNDAICNFDFGENKFMNMVLGFFSLVLIYYKILFGCLIRIAIHPNDVKNKNFSLELRIIRKLIKKGWKPITTQELDKNF